MSASFIFGGDTGETAETLARRRAIADALLGQSIGTPKTIGDGLAALGKGFAGYMAGKALHKQELDWRKGGDSVFSALFDQSGETGAAPSSSAVAAALAGSGALGGAAGPSPDLSGNDIYSSFMDTVKSRITNPNGLAAVASTGKAESGFSPKNSFGSWSDPSESGEAGTAGGIMSWRGPRFEAMRAFAAKNGGDPNNPSPQLQAQFFLQEDPGLIDRLNSAKSPAEAQQMMNNAWRFAGYDRPGGEAARRIAQANSFASQFTRSPADPVRVASLDPSAGMATAAPGGAVAAALAGARPAAAQPQSPAQALTGAQPAPPPVQSPRAAGAPMLGAKPTPGAMPAGQSGGVQVAGGGPTIDQLMKAATDPRLSAEQRSVVGMLLKQRMAASDPATQLEMEKNRLDMEKTRIETERLRNPQMTPAEKARLDFEERKLQSDQNKLIEVGGSLVDPNTHQAVYTGQQTDWEKLDDGTLYNKRTGETKAVASASGGGKMFNGNSVDAQALNWLVDNNKVTREQAAQIAAGKTITGPNGEMMFLTPAGIVAQMPGQAPQAITAPAATSPTPAPAPAPTPAPAAPPMQTPPAAAPAPAASTSPRADNSSNGRPGIIPLTDPKSTTKPPNEAQLRNQQLYTVVAPELGIVEETFPALSDLGNQAWSQLPLGADYMTTPEFQRASNSLKTIIASYLYSTSGATATPSEVDNQASILTPKPGEAKASVDDKLSRIRTMVEAIKSNRGDVQEEPAGNSKSKTSTGVEWSIEP
ncbi:MAG: hypothetical protein EOR51_12015 [Mesorhizobium sp.]|uniref:phage tail tip lysozyme n=1 Tax=Mesorhizobium sp. TaxID=1871066 RepID=UPI000FE94B25|nr:phage tail tip lysozyme [Mesorhizobium sp.]RWK79630.1 MAG: hypothetical protein EOR50_05745 [Mesorhizobium sp.]RWK82405.1 MAG: hypothetical protein EOR51_12015 [Mesorhizobium sp.]RWL08776.1 MAG: hypothetical protein EOR55_03535 [Mesorhizobium sp.]